MLKEFLHPRDTDDSSGFFIHIRVQHRRYNLRSSIAFGGTAIMLLLLAFLIGFSFDSNIVLIGFIPVADITLSCTTLAFFGISAWGCCTSLKAIFDETEYHQMMRAIKKLGDPGVIGKELQAICPSPYVLKGELRFNERILFFSSNDFTRVIDPVTIRNIESSTSVNTYRRTVSHCITIHYELQSSRLLDRIYISVDKEGILPLMEELNRLYPTHKE